MYKVFLSYGHADSVSATRVFTALTALGQTVWMDEASRNDAEEPGDFVGIPAGQRHREVIEQAIGESAAFVVLDSPAWRESTYCQDELRMARTSGKRVAVFVDPALPPLGLGGLSVPRDDFDDLVAQLEARVEVALAHVRLDQTRLGEVHPGWAVRLLGDPERLADATLLLSAEPGPDAPQPTQEQLAFATAVVTDAQRRRRVRSRVVTGFIAVLAVLAVLTSWAGVNASQDAQRAKAASRMARSLEASEQAIRGAGPQARELAEHAWQLDQNSESRSAMAVTSAADHLLSVVPTNPMSLVKQLVSLPDGGFVVGDGRVLASLDADGRRTAAGVLPSYIGAAPLVATGGLALAVSRPDDSGSRKLYRYHVATGNAKPSRLTGVTAVGSGPFGEAWLGYADGSFARYLPESDEAQVLGRGRGALTAITATSEAVVALDDGNRLSSWARHQPGADWTVNLTEAVTPLPDHDRVAPDRSSGEDLTTRLPTDLERQFELDRVVACSDRLHVLVGAMLGGTVPASRHVSLSLTGTPLTPFRSTRAISLACHGEASAVGAVPMMIALDDFGPTSAVPYGLVSRRDRQSVCVVAATGDGLAVVSNQGELRMTGSLDQTIRDVGTATWATPVADGVLLQDLTGGLWFVRGADGAQPVGRLDAPLGRAYSARGGAIARSGSELYLLGPNGVRSHWTMPDDVSSVTVSSDGDTAVLAGATSVTLQPLSDATSSTLSVSGLEAEETVLEAVVDNGAVFVSTSVGRLLRLGPTGTIAGTWKDAGVSRVAMTFRPSPEAGVIVGGNDGVVRVLDRDLRLVAARSVGSVGAIIRTSPNAGLVAVPLQSSRVLLLDAESLEIRQVTFSHDSIRGFDFWVSEHGTSAVLFSPYERVREAGDGNIAQVVPGAEYWKEALVTGTYPELGDGHRELEAALVTVPICTTCTPS